MNNKEETAFELLYCYLNETLGEKQTHEICYTFAGMKVYFPQYFKKIKRNNRIQYQYYVEGRSYDNIARMTDISKRQIANIIRNMDIEYYYSLKKQYKLKRIRKKLFSA